MRRNGFTIINLIVVIVLIVILFAIAAVFAAQFSSQNRRLYDSAHIRGIHVAFTLWAGNNEDLYPMPSAIDVDNTTVAELGRAKDTTSNIMALLLQEGFINPTLCVSPLENNEYISKYISYEIEQPQAAVDPEKALWDPGFTADFTAEGGGHFSYAHLIPVGNRLNMWTDTGNADEAILSNRGPEMASVDRSNGNIVTQFAYPKTRTLKIAGSKKSWTGNIVYNDNHVRFTEKLYAHNKQPGEGSNHRPISLANDDGTTTDYHDVLFADEEEAESNLFLGIFTTAGENKEDFTAIWD